jgi:hypothetical protein
VYNFCTAAAVLQAAQTGADQGSLCESSALAAACRDRGNSLFLQANYLEALSAYSEGLQQVPQQDPTRSILLSNRAACHLALQDAAAAEADCRAGLTLSPTNHKLHYRLAKALVAQQQQGTPDAAAAMAAAVALLQSAGQQLTPELEQLYSQIAAATAAAPDFQGVQLPVNAADVCHVAKSAAMQRAVLAGAGFIVLSPGTYTAAMFGGCVFVRDTTLLGLGSVKLTSPVSHAVWVQKGTTTLANMQLAGSGGGAAVCASPGMQGSSRRSSSSSADMPSIRMIGCRIEDYPEAGLLLHGGHGELLGCCFRRCQLHAIEVRQGGSLRATDTTLDACQQGALRKVVILYSPFLK